MLDVHRILGITLYAESAAELLRITQALVPLTSQLDVEDLGVIADACHKGPGEITGALLNHPVQSPREFISQLKSNFNSIATADLLVPKHFIVASQLFDQKARYTLSKLIRANTDCHIYLYTTRSPHTLLVDDKTYPIKPLSELDKEEIISEQRI